MTHAEKVMALLSDGKPHSHLEGYRLGVMLHSRVADLRKKGHRIDCWREGPNYLYRLREGSEAGGSPEPSRSAAEDSRRENREPEHDRMLHDSTRDAALHFSLPNSPPGHSPEEPGGELPSVHPDQMTLEAA